MKTMINDDDSEKRPERHQMGHTPGQVNETATYATEKGPAHPEYAPQPEDDISLDFTEYLISEHASDPELPPRAQLLAEASALITRDRNNQYGPPDQDFSRTAAALNAYGYCRVDANDTVHPIESADIAKVMIMLKLSRSMWQKKRDTWVDIAGYAGCGFEVDGCDD